MDLRANLKRLRLPPTALIPLAAHSTHKHLSLDAYLGLLSRQGYIERHRVGESAPSNKKGGKRGRASQGGGTQAGGATQGGGEEGGAFEWRWGNRAHSEVGEKSIAGFASEFMVERMGIEEDGDEEEGEEGEGAGAGAGAGGRAAREKGRRERERKEKARKNILEKMVKGFERSAGGNLSEIK